MNTLRKHTVALLYMLKESMATDDYYKTIFSKSRPGMLSGKVTLKNLGYQLKSDADFMNFKQEYFIDQSKVSYIPNYILYEELLLKNNNYTINDTILSDSFIKELDEKYKLTNNDYIYVIDGQIISRLKVLRIYSILKDNQVLMEDAKVFALTYGSYINEDIFSLLANITNYSYEGGANGISK